MGRNTPVTRLIRRKAKEYGENPYFLLALAQVESGFDPRRVSSRDTVGGYRTKDVRYGLMQVTYREAIEHDWGIRSLFLPLINIDVGVSWLKRARDRLHGVLHADRGTQALDNLLLFSAYKYGPEAVLQNRLPEAVTMELNNFQIAIMNWMPQIERKRYV